MVDPFQDYRVWFRHSWRLEEMEWRTHGGLGHGRQTHESLVWSCEIGTGVWPSARGQGSIGKGKGMALPSRDRARTQLGPP